MKKLFLNKEINTIIENSVSIREVLIKLNIEPTGGNYRTFKKYVKEFNLNIDHFTGKNLKGRTFEYKRKDINEYLKENSNIQSLKLKRKLLENKIFEYKCNCCKNDTWLNNPIPLELDHINGINTDNRLENLRLLCPNCHALTPTYRGRNIKNNKTKTSEFTEKKWSKELLNSIFNRIETKEDLEQQASENNISIRTLQTVLNKNGFYLREKFSKYSFKIEWPSKEELEKLIQEKSFVQIGKELGVSGKAVGNHVKKLGLTKSSKK